ncbi:hypothetical protein [Sphingopyxis sp. JAI128]|uniref:hypothetical protein n=1 Tax=Sphingopyxis sp. JAI128 TaxID=2723066 RepID=UPI00160BA123|nr:hypothetical protein [Sphingopyxis sp. JAI128]MBB6424694.1 nitrate/nitrite transporter NarK [Sphingopyxis sp. JAI128]
MKTAATYFNAKERSFVLGLGGIAPNVGAILTPLFIPLMATMRGWQATQDEDGEVQVPAH